MAESAPHWVMVAGPNGSGKSTLIAALRADPRFALPALYVNADDLLRDRGLQDSRAAQMLADDMRTQALASRTSVMYETVMSHPGKIAELQKVRNAGYHVTVLLVATGHPDINVRRVALRVAAGGHAVPEDRTRRRYTRTLALAPTAIGYANQAFVFDNSLGGETGRGLSLQAGLAEGRLVPVADGTAHWVTRLIEQVNARAGELPTVASSAQNTGVPPQLARLHGSRTAGPLLAVGRHYVLQYDESSGIPVVHDRVLLGQLVDQWVPRQTVQIEYNEGVATVQRAA